MSLEPRAPSPEQDSRQGWALVALAITIAVHTALMRTGTDFAVYHAAGARFLAGQPLYPTDADLDFLYSPAAAALFAPLALLPFRVALGLYTLLSVFALARVARWSRERAGAPVAAYAALIVVAPHLMQVIAYGQAEVLVLWLMVESERRSHKPVLSGALWALACLVKLPALILLLPALAFRQWRRVASMAVVGAGLLALALSRHGGLSQLWAWQAHNRAVAPMGLCRTANQSVFGLACDYWGPPETPGYLAFAFGLGLALVLLFIAAVWRRRAMGDAQHLAACFAFYLAAVLSPLGWWVNLIGLIPLLLWLAARANAFAWAGLSVAAVAALANHHLWGAERVAWLLPWHHYGVAGLAVACSAAACALTSVAVRPRAFAS